MLKNTSDLKLLEMLASDNVSAFEEIYNRYSKNMFFYAMNIFKKKDVCEDLIQNVFTDFWVKRKEVKITNLKSYLFQSVKFQIFNHIRNQKISSEDLSRLHIIDISANLTQKIEFDELQKIINDQITRLPERCKLIFMLSRYEQKSNKEIASQLGISIQAVKNQISKAIKKIRKNLSSEEVVFYFLLFSINL